MTILGLGDSLSSFLSFGRGGDSISIRKSISIGVSNDSSRDGVSVGQRHSCCRGVGNGVASIDMRSSIGEDRGSLSRNFGCLSNFDNRGNCVVDIGVVGGVGDGCSDNSGANRVNETVLVVIFRESLKSNVRPSPFGGSQITNSWMNRTGSSPGGQILIQWAALGHSEEGREANENFHDDVV